MKQIPFYRGSLSGQTIVQSQQTDQEIIKRRPFRKPRRHFTLSENDFKQQNFEQVISGLDVFTQASASARSSQFCESLQVLQERTRTTAVGFLKLALQTNRIMMDYQPVVYTETRQLVGIEILVHWQNGPKNETPVNLDFPLTETSGLAECLTNWMLQVSFRKVSDWWAQGARMHVFVNIPLCSLLNCKYVDWLLFLCSEYGASPDWITLGVDECAFPKDASSFQDVLNKIRSKGFHLSIDDFGIGDSSVTQLLQLPFSEIKIDRSYVSNIHLHQRTALILKSIMRMSQEMELRAVAEGVDSLADFELLKRWQCPLSQGRIFSNLLDDLAVVEMAQLRT